MKSAVILIFLVGYVVVMTQSLRMVLGYPMVGLALYLGGILIYRLSGEVE